MHIAFIDLLPATALRENTWSSGGRLHAPNTRSLCTQTKESENFNRRLLGNSLKKYCSQCPRGLGFGVILLCVYKESFLTQSFSAYQLISFFGRWLGGPGEIQEM
jgi:hypothetical protein